MRWRVVTEPMAALAAVALVALPGCSLQQDLAQRPPGGGAPTRAPAIKASTLTGHAFDWSAVRGHAVVVDFWASWCGPCRAEQKDLNALFSKYSRRGVIFVGVDMRDDNAAARAYESDFRVGYSSVADPDEQVSALYNVAAPPTLVVVDPSGRIVDRFLGTVVGVSVDLDRLT
jgi:thiol-disulfide isomerase/thioredoxin